MRSLGRWTADIDESMASVAKEWHLPIAKPVCLQKLLVNAIDPCIVKALLVHVHKGLHQARQAAIPIAVPRESSKARKERSLRQIENPELRRKQGCGPTKLTSARQ